MQCGQADQVGETVVAHAARPEAEPVEVTQACQMTESRARDPRTIQVEATQLLEASESTSSLC